MVTQSMSLAFKFIAFQCFGKLFRYTRTIGTLLCRELLKQNVALIIVHGNVERVSLYVIIHILITAIYKVAKRYCYLTLCGNIVCDDVRWAYSERHIFAFIVCQLLVYVGSDGLVCSVESTLHVKPVDSSCCNVLHQCRDFHVATVNNIHIWRANTLQCKIVLRQMLSVYKCFYSQCTSVTTILPCRISAHFYKKSVRLWVVNYRQANRCAFL